MTQPLTDIVQSGQTLTVGIQASILEALKTLPSVTAAQLELMVRTWCRGQPATTSALAQKFRIVLLANGALRKSDRTDIFIVEPGAITPLLA